MHIDDYTQDVRWKNPPKVIICTGQTTYSRADVEFALEAWGADYREIVEREGCNRQPRKNAIKITDSEGFDLAGKWATTSELFSTGRDGLDYFYSAVTRIEGSCKKIDILVHEIGHALGYRHYNKSADVMNSVIRC